MLEARRSRDWWKTTAADRFAKIPASALDHRRFWDAMHAVTPQQLAGDQPARSRCGSSTGSALDCSSVALDMTNFATFIDTGNQQGADRPAGQGQAETRTTCGWWAWAWWSPATAGSR